MDTKNGGKTQTQAGGTLAGVLFTGCLDPQNLETRVMYISLPSYIILVSISYLQLVRRCGNR